ncbi:hypothetical protein D3C72_1576480 [compost metagenome]
MQLDDTGTGIERGLDLLAVRIDEDRHPAAGGRQLAGEVAHLVKVADHVEAALGGHFFALFRHQAHVFRLHAQRVGQHLVGQRHFQVHARLDHAAHGVDIVVLDMAAVFTQMQRDQVGTAGFGHQRRFDRAGETGTARLAQRRHMIDVHT